jgi:uncharacterized caspase-like protein
MKWQVPKTRLQLSAQICCVAVSLFLVMRLLGAAELTEVDLKRMRTEKRVALVIGNGNYLNFQRLDNPVNDARGVAAALTAAGFVVTLKVDATREQMIQALTAFDQSLRDSEVGLFYFAGHAAQVDWRNFMVPVAARLDASGKPAELVGQVEQEAVDLADVLKQMGAAGKRLNIVVLDACRDNPFTTRAIEVSRSLSRSTGNVPFKIGSGLAQTFAPSRTFLAYSTAPGQVASDGAGSNSPYSGALIEALKVPGLKLEDVFKQVRNAVASATGQVQIPWDNSSVFDDFYFRIPASVAAAKAQAKKGELNTTFIAP